MEQQSRFLPSFNSITVNDKKTIRLVILLLFFFIPQIIIASIGVYYLKYDCSYMPGVSITMLLIIDTVGLFATLFGSFMYSIHVAVEFKRVAKSKRTADGGIVFQPEDAENHELTSITIEKRTNTREQIVENINKV
jgi:hypothetical protein